jgi:hypothetical protein
MTRSELYYRESRHESFPPKHRTNQPQPSGSLNEDTAQRIVTFYTSGHSIESITREVGRARHLIVYLLQSRGVFGNCRTEPDREEPKVESPAVEEQKKKLVIKERKLDPVADKGPEPKIEVQAAPRKATRIRKSKAPEQLKSVAIEKPKAELPAAEKAPVTGRWSPQVVDALVEVVTQSEVNPGMSLDEVKTMVSGLRRKVPKRKG